MPENTIPAFIKAIDLGVGTLEMDLAVSRDRQLVVSHDPYFSAAFSLDKKRTADYRGTEKDYNIYKWIIPKSNYTMSEAAETKTFPNRKN